MLRIVGGEYAGRRVKSVDGIRPTTERLREALFSIWQTRVRGARFLDLFCGSGAVGLEALSRGAAPVVLADSGRLSLAAAQRNVASLGAGRVAVIRCRVPKDLDRLVREVGSFDLVFADPPYEFRDLEAFLEASPVLLVSGATLAVEHHRDVELALPATLERLDERTYGQSRVSFLRCREACAGGMRSPRGTS